MGLSAQKSLRLKDAGLIDLYNNEQAIWAKAAQEAYDYTADSVKQAGEPVRPDDLIPVLVPVLEVTEILRDYLNEERLRQKYWYQFFGELIIDQLWSELNPDDEEDED
jgi:hypothetical protein